MDYKAFISSTFLDLKDHRAHVIRELRKAGFFVDPIRWVKEKGDGERTQIALDLYLKLVEQEHGTIQFVGLPQLKDNPNVPIYRLYVEPAVASRWISPDVDPSEWPDTRPVIDAVAGNRRLVLLGDPGSGKSTLVSWIAWQLARHHSCTTGMSD